MKIKFKSDEWRVTGDKACLTPARPQRQAAPFDPSAPVKRGEGSLRTATTLTASRHASHVTRHREKGIALVITLIMLAVTLVMAVAFLALARRERGSVSTTTDTKVARDAAESAQANGTAQLLANVLSSFNGLGSSNGYNLHLFVSTNYINPYGFVTGSGNPTNVNYSYANGSPLSVQDFQQNVSNLWFLPRVPVFVPTNLPTAPVAYDFRYYLDLNQNGRYDRYGYVPEIAPNGDYIHPDGSEDTVPVNVVTNMAPGGDPEWIGILEHPDAPHGPNNHFIARYAYIAVPVGNTLDVNYIHNEALNGIGTVTATAPAGGDDGYMRNQGVGSWELNLAAFLVDLNTNIWGRVSGSGVSAPPGAASFYQYNEPNRANSGLAFSDARALLAYRYNLNPLPSANNTLFNAFRVFPYDGIDDYSQGLLQTNLDFNEDASITVNTGNPWSGSDNTNHFFTVSDFFDPSKTGLTATPGQVAAGIYFGGRLKAWGTNVDTYNRYTYYRMLDQLGTDSSPDDGKLNLNYSNAVVSYVNYGGIDVPTSVGIITGAETNLVPWRPTDFFNAAADQLMRLYTKEWFQSDPSNYLATYYGYLPRGYVDATGLGVTNFPNYGVTNQIPTFGITNIPVWVNGNFVYSPAINRLLQLAANIYDATTNLNNGLQDNLPHVFRPIVGRDSIGNLFIMGYTAVTNVANNASIPPDPQLAPPYDPSQLTNSPNVMPQPIRDGNGLVNVYGVPWIIGAKKGLPSFNQLSLVTAAQVTRKLELTRTSLNPETATYGTNEMYVMGLSNNVGISFWNSYNSDYPRPLRVVVVDISEMALTNSSRLVNLHSVIPLVTNVVINSWPGSKWSGTPPNATPQSASFLPFSWTYIFQNPEVYNMNTHQFDPTGLWQVTIPRLPQLDQFGVAMTNYLQAYILDGNKVIDYVQLRDPINTGNLNQALADLNYPQPNNAYLQWSTNGYPSDPQIPYGVINQVWVSGHPASAPPYGGQWSVAPTPMGVVSPGAEAAYFNGFFTPTFQYNGKTYVNHQLVTQAPYTPSRAVYTSYLLQANDPLVHYLSSDLNAQTGAYAVWNGKLKYQNGIWTHSDDPLNQPLPVPPVTPLGGRYQPWGASGQMIGLTSADTNVYNMAYKDSLVWGPDYWDFPTNPYPAVGWIGRVHRGTPWQTVDLKSTNILLYAQNLGNQGMQNIGSNTWAAWTGNIRRGVYGQYYDAANSSPLQDRLLFDIFTTRFNDNSVRGSLPVNQTHLGAWSALFSGMPVLENNPVGIVNGNVVWSYTNVTISPAGVNAVTSPLSNIVASINNVRANTNLFPYHAFTHVGDVLAAPALSDASPFLNAPPGSPNFKYGVNDEMYEWLPQHMMGLVRNTEQRYVLYCYGQALRPAPGGTVLSGPYFQLVTNYQVVAESAARVQIRIDNANSSQPRAVVESYNVLPP